MAKFVLHRPEFVVFESNDGRSVHAMAVVEESGGRFWIYEDGMHRGPYTRESLPEDLRSLLEAEA